MFFIKILTFDLLEMNIFLIILQLIIVLTMKLLNIEPLIILVNGIVSDLMTLTRGVDYLAGFGLGQFYVRRLENTLRCQVAGVYLVDGRLLGKVSHLERANLIIQEILFVELIRFISYLTLFYLFYYFFVFFL